MHEMEWWYHFMSCPPCFLLLKRKTKTKQNEKKLFTKKMRSFFRMIPFLAAASCATAEDTLAQLVASTPELSTLLKLVTEAGLVSALNEVTVFAPTDEAFDMLAPEIVDKLMGDKELLTEVLTSHVVDGLQDSTKLLAEKRVETLSKFEVEVRKVDDKVFVDQSEVIKADVMASNGIAHLIDYVIVPKTKKLETTVVELAAQARSGLRVLSELLIKQNLTEPLSNASAPLTVFAPRNEAFVKCVPPEVLRKLMLPINSAVLTKILLFHVVGMSKVPENVATTTLEGSKLTRHGDEIEVNGKKVARIVRREHTESKDAEVCEIDCVLVPPDVDLSQLQNSTSPM